MIHRVIIIATFLSVCFISVAQKGRTKGKTSPQTKKAKEVYKPIINIDMDLALPLVYELAKEIHGVKALYFNYGEGTLMTGSFEYYRGLGKYRAKWKFTSHDELLDIHLVDIENYNNESHSWSDSYEGILFKKETELRVQLADQVKAIRSDTAKIRLAKALFYNDLDVHAAFYNTATKLAGDRWFENNLKNEKVSWKLRFVDVQKNSSNSPFKYKESYYLSKGGQLESITRTGDKFIVSKYTNNDEMVLAKKGELVQVEGYCNKLDYKAGTFNVWLKDELEANQLSDEKSNTSSSSSDILSKAEDLKKLKELYDLGAITEEEYKAEKQKLLNN